MWAQVGLDMGYAQTSLTMSTDVGLAPHRCLPPLPTSEAMSTDVAKYAPNLDIDLELEVAPNKRLRPVEAVRPSVRLDGQSGPPAGKRKRGDFDFKGKPRAEVSGARITVWYEEEDKNNRKVDVPYIGIVKSCDPREGLYVQFESYEDQEMLITNEDDWRWGSHSGGRKPPERSFQR